MTDATRRRICLCSLSLLALPRLTFAMDGALVSVDERGRALDGHDTTAYWYDDTASPGSSAHGVDWRGARWLFRDARRAAAFLASPEDMAPQFGGHCTRAMSLGKTVNGDPEVWRIFDGRLYLFARPVGGVKFDAGPRAMIAKAQARWDSL